MKLLPSRLRDYLSRFAIIIAVYCVLYQIVARADIMERVMTFTFSWWELAVIVLFLTSRLAVYLVIVPALVALAVFHTTRFLLSFGQRSISLR